MTDFKRPTKDEAKAIVKELTQRYFKFEDTYKSTKYNEAQIRVELINPFFKALGWNVDNTGLDPDKREVIVETSVEVYDELTDKQKAIKHPDYGFYHKTKEAKFYVEAKHPLVNLSTKPEPAFQLRRYAYSDRLPVSIITDFEEFVVYDCTVQPRFSDTNVRGFQLKYLTYHNYVKEFDYLWEHFSYEAIEQGRFDKFVKTDTKKRGVSSLDLDFVQSLDQWRELLARDIFQNNPNINTADLNFSVQNILDRIIFLRVCEDREIELYEQLKGVYGTKGKYYQNLVKDFERAALRYNSDLFNFKRDTITPKLHISDETVKHIIDDLYVPKSPYVFKIIPVEILGNAYERFLGKTITVNAQKQVIIEEKPEVRKAGGVFYTPQYIVNYIVENIIGRLIDNKTPEQVAELTILDPSCGSGSFLIGAYQFLLDWHKLYYQKNAKKYTKTKIKPFRTDGSLTNAERKRILLNNIYGVDLDAQAVEVTKLSLLLKALEGETAESVKQLASAFERVLPSLDENIRCGNSLIDSGGLKKLAPSVSKAEKAQINPFDWADAFPKVFEKGGFDAIVGNPPYARLQTLQEFQPIAVPYFRKSFQSATTGNFDIYVLFIERAFQLLNATGVLGFIQPHKFFQADFGEGIRMFLANEKAISEIVHFGAAQVFADATTYTCLLFLDKKRRKNFYFVKVNDLETPVETLRAVLDNTPNRYEATDIDQPKDGTKWNFGADSAAALLDKIKQQPQTLADVTRKIFQGIPTGNDKVFVLKVVEEKSTTWRCWSNALEKNIEIEKGLVKSFLMGKDVKRYEVPKPLNVCIFPYNTDADKPYLMLENDLQNRFPLGYAYLKENKKALVEREHKRFEKTWWQFSRPQNLNEFEAIKVMTPDIANQPQFTIDTQHLYHTTTIYSFSFLENVIEHQKYFLGVMNSPLMWFFLTSTGNILRGGFFRFKTEYLKPFPIRRINFKNKDEKSIHDKIVQLVEEVLRLKADIATAASTRESERLEKKRVDTERVINRLVYELYDLTKEEIALIEGQ